MIELKKPRTSDFKIGKIHGVPSAQKSGSEVALQRHLFNSQIVEIIRSKNKSDNSLIRLIAYEMPVGFYRDCCVDLVGYDQHHDLYLIELKRGGSKEAILKVIDQINGYAEIVKRPEVKRGIELEFQKAYHFPKGHEFRNVKKVILSEKEFYLQNVKPYISKSESDIEFLFFRNSRVLKGPCERIQLHLWKKKK